MIWSSADFVRFLTDKKTLSVYNFNGRFIWTMRENNNNKNPEISKKLYIDLHFNEWNKYLTPWQNMT